MAELTEEERIALVVRARVATARADAAAEWAALVDRRVEPARRTLERFRAAYGREPDLEAPDDAKTVHAWIAAAGGGNITREMYRAASEASAESERCNREAAAALEALRDALPGGGVTVSQWLGVDDETLERAVEQALQEPS
jgi:hypothetical protein